MIIYIVKQGDTLYSIADLYGLSYNELQGINQLPNPENLVIGQTVIIPEDDTPLRDIRINGYVYPYVDKTSLSNALPSVTYLTIFGYGFTLQGELIPPDDNELILLSYEYRSAPIMLLSSVTENGNFNSNHASILFNNLELQNTVIDNIIITMDEKGYLGLDIDFEFINPEDKDAYISFIENATVKLNAKGYTVNVDLAPKVSDDQKGLLYEGHDYKRIGEIVDSVLVMTYEWGYTYGPPMAVAPIDQVRRVLDYAVTVIPLDKIYMGIPNYGYDWPLPYEKGTTAAITIGNMEAITIAAEHGSIIEYDEKSQAPYFFYTDYNGINRVVWFEDARSIEAKLNLVNEYGLRGAGYWNLMREFPQNWVVLNSLYTVEKVVI